MMVYILDNDASYYHPISDANEIVYSVNNPGQRAQT